MDKDEFMTVLMLVAFLCLVVFMSLVTVRSHVEELELRDGCRSVCGLYQMDYEGIKDGNCACSSNLGVMRYVPPGDPGSHKG